MQRSNIAGCFSSAGFGNRCPDAATARDNAKAESFFSRFKAELVKNGIFESVEDARSEIFNHTEDYYNRNRLHSGIGYKSPLEFEKELKIKHRSESFVSPKCLTVSRLAE